MGVLARKLLMAGGLDLAPYAGWLSGAYASSSGNSYTFTNRNLGTPHPNRVIMGFAAHHVGSAGRVLSSVTIGGVAGTVVNKKYDSTTEDHYAIFYAHVPEGETGDLKFHIGYIGQQYSYQLFELRNLGLAPALKSNTYYSSSVVDYTKNTVNGGVLIAGMANNSTSQGTTYGAPAIRGGEHSNGYISNSAGLIFPASDATPETITITPPSLTQRRHVALTAWSPI